MTRPLINLIQKPLHRCLMFIVGLFLCGFVNANICLELKLPDNPDYQFQDNLFITSPDGNRLAANLMTPKATPPASGWPTIIFVNSWVVEEHEYIVQAAQFAKKGYQVLSYSARGWGCSDGLINVIADSDMMDLTAIIDWLETHTGADMGNIGISGISYGSGMSLRGAALEPRIKTAVAMSTWGNLQDALYGEQTPRLFWGFFLVASGYLTGTMDPSIAENYLNLITHQNIPETMTWAEERSAAPLVDLINERQVPIYLANNFSDYLFHPNQVMRFYESLTGPKRLDLNQGTHASGEGFGLIGLENDTWKNTHDWFDFWLKGQNTGIMNRPAFTMQTDLSYRREEFSTWPIPEAEDKTFYLGPRSLFSQGQLRTTPYSSWFTVTNTINSGLDSGATTGIPILSEILDSHLKTPVKASIPLLNRIHSIAYQSDKLGSIMKIRGIPKVTLNVEPSRKEMQLIGYLYDVDALGIGTLITHGPVTRYDAAAGQRVALDFELLATAYDVPAGHRVAIAFDTLDLLYAPPTLNLYSIQFKHASGYQSTLTLPLVD